MIDEYEKEWKVVMNKEKEVIVDEEGFRCKYVPKESIAIGKDDILSVGGKGGIKAKPI